MYLIRRAREEDLDTLLKLAKMVHFINLPADKDIIADKIRRSQRSFRAAATGEPASFDDSGLGLGRHAPLFMFVIADAVTGNALGTSSIIARMGGPGNPNIALELSRRELFSVDLQTGMTHIIGRLVLDESGPTEIGGLILGPSYRNHPDKIGKQLSLVRFHYMGLHREQFADRVLAEMMGPITPDGQNSFWEYFGRRFINLTYYEADKFCQYSREFMISLLPKEDIYLTLLPPEARALLAKVGPETLPARRMLENLGFRYPGRVDPFDGGPHLEARTAEIELVRNTRRAEFGGACAEDEARGRAFVSVESDRGEFRCVYAPFVERADTIQIPPGHAELLEIDRGERIGFTPVETGDRKSLRESGATADSAKASTGRSTAAGRKRVGS